VVSAVVLLGVAALTVRSTLRTPEPAAGEVRRLTPGAAYALFAGITAINPATVVYFAAVVLGNPGLVTGAEEAAVFVLAAFVASASWQLTLAGGGAALARFVTSPRGHLVTGLTSAAVIAALAVWTLWG
jgi:arginine exporter protein ArgO